jgi:dicarboxylate transporter 10
MSGTVEASLLPPLPREQPRWVGGESSLSAELTVGVAAMMAVCITHPIDQTKIRAQTQKVRHGMLATMRNTVQAGGIRELWVGLSGSLVRQATYGSVRFGTYAELNSRDSKKRKRRGRGDATALELIKNGAIAGLFAGVAGVPGGESLLSGADDRARTGPNGGRWRQTRRKALKLSQRLRWTVSDLQRGRRQGDVQRGCTHDSSERTIELGAIVLVSCHKAKLMQL